MGAILDHLGVSDVHPHSLRHQFASEALDTDPRELANISQVLGHDSVQTTLRFHIHPSANAEQRIGAMMNTAGPPRPAREPDAGPPGPGTRPRGECRARLRSWPPWEGNEVSL